MEGEMLKQIVWVLVLSTFLLALPQGVEDAIRHSGIPKKDISLIIKEAGNSANVVARLNENSVRKPASVIKVLTIYAALLEFGFDHRWRTEFYSNGPIRNGVLAGDLIIKGYGDPTLSSDDLPQIVKAIRAKGITKITGHIVIDRSYFRVGTENSSHFDEHPYSPYNAMPDAMMFNERVSIICVNPREDDISKQDADGSYRLINQLQKVNKPCRGRYSWPAVKIDPNSPRPSVILKGKISKRCGERKICKVITKPYLSFYYALKEALKSEGIEAKGTMRLRNIPQNAIPLSVHLSQPFEEILAKTAKESNNLYARHLLLYLGAKHFGAPATVDKGRRAVAEVLKAHSVPIDTLLKVDNGSGLSRTAKLNAKILADVLDHAYMHYGQRWMDILSIAGVDGTIKKRFRGSVVKNRAWMKTGTLRRVKNIAGYVKSKSGRLYTVVILVNTTKGRWKAAKLQDEIITWIVKSKEQQASSVGSFGNVSPLDEVEMPLPVIERFYVQAGAFGDVPKKAYLLRLEQLELPYRVRYTDKYRVLVGPYAQREDAIRALQTVKTHINKEAFLLKDE